MTILDGIPFLPAAHFTKGREAKVSDIVIHWMAGTLASTDATFTGGGREASAHYGIEGATIHQYVKDADTAWHCGDRAENHRSIGIEHSAAPGRDATPETIATSVALITALCRKYGISPDHIYPHKKFFNTACPGTLPIADIIARVRAQLGSPSAPQTQEQIMADLILTNPLTHETTSAASGLNSTWRYVLETWYLVRALAAKAGVDVVDEGAIASQVVALLAPTLTTHVAALSDADVAQIATAVANEQARRLVA